MRCSTVITTGGQSNGCHFGNCGGPLTAPPAHGFQTLPTSRSVFKGLPFISPRTIVKQADGQKSAACRVVVGLRLNETLYPPAYFFARASLVSGLSEV